MKGEWLYHCAYYSQRAASLWSGGNRKILRNRQLTFDNWDDSLQLEDVGFTPAKLQQLERLYLHEESRSVAADLWARRRMMAKTGNVAFSTFNHLLKNGDSVDEAVINKSKHGSVQGPCMLGVTITWMWRTRAAVDVFYRSVELYKKLPADIVFLRDVLLTPFDFKGMQLTVTCHFANVTLHPAYWPCVLAHVDDPIATMEEIKQKDPVFHRHLVKGAANYLCDEHSHTIDNWAQGQRVKKHAVATFTGTRLRTLQAYLRANHPSNAPIKADNTWQERAGASLRRSN